MQARKENNHEVLGTVLRKIYQEEVDLEFNHLDKRKVLELFLEKFKILCLKESCEFFSLFKGFYLTGSYFEDLRVHDANEFDINIVFDLSLFAECRIDEFVNPLSYATCHLKKSSNDSRIPSCDKFFEKNYLIGDKVRNWFQSLLGKFCRALDDPLVLKDSRILGVKETQSGPASTVKVFYKSSEKVENPEWISIDLVPVFQIDARQLKRCAFLHIHNLSEESLQSCYLVPKPLKGELCNVLTPKQAKRVWRIHFPEVEKQIIAQNTTLKTLVKLIKDLGVKQNWAVIPSYFIKVVAFWLANKHQDPLYWNNFALGELFIEFLKALEKHLLCRKLGHIIYPKFNLFQVLKSHTLCDIGNRIHNIIEELEKNPKKAYDFFRFPVKYHHLR